MKWLRESVGTALITLARSRSVLPGGESTAEMAAGLFLSPHTVRDYLKAVFEKFGVSTRGELVARPFGQHYADLLHDTMAHVDRPQLNFGPCVPEPARGEK